MSSIEASKMAKKFREYNLDQQLLVPPDIRDWVPEGHFARFIDDLVMTLDLDEFEASYKGKDGQPPYDPALMLKVVLYSFCSGIFSSRRMEKSTYDNVGARFLAGNQHPDYSSFCNFRKRHPDAVQGLFIQVLAICREMGLYKLGQVAIDGTIMKANASKKRCVPIKDLDELLARDKALVVELLAKWSSTDAKEKPDEDLPKKLRQAQNRIAALERAKASVEKRAREKYKKELQDYQALEAQRLADHEANVAASVSRRENGVCLREARNGAGLTQRELADKIGLSRSRLAQIEAGLRLPKPAEIEALNDILGITNLCFEPVEPAPFVPAKAPEFQLPDNQVNLTDPESPIISRGPGISTQGFNAQFAVDVENQIIVGSLVSSEATDRVLMVPVVQEIIDANDGKKPKEALLDSGYFSTAALADPILEGIDIYMPPERKPKKFQNPGPMAQRMREKIASEGGKARRKLRSTTVEPVFGQTKYGKGFQSFLTRGMTNVTTEWTLVGVAHNIQKILKRWK